MSASTTSLSSTAVSSRNTTTASPSPPPATPSPPELWAEPLSETHRIAIIVFLCVGVILLFLFFYFLHRTRESTQQEFINFNKDDGEIYYYNTRVLAAAEKAKKQLQELQSIAALSGLSLSRDQVAEVTGRRPAARSDARTTEQRTAERAQRIGASDGLRFTEEEAAIAAAREQQRRAASARRGNNHNDDDDDNQNDDYVPSAVAVAASASSSISPQRSVSLSHVRSSGGIIAGGGSLDYSPSLLAFGGGANDGDDGSSRLRPQHSQQMQHQVRNPFTGLRRMSRNYDDTEDL